MSNKELPGSFKLEEAALAGHRTACITKNDQFSFPSALLASKAPDDDRLEESSCIMKIRGISDLTSPLDKEKCFLIRSVSAVSVSVPIKIFDKQIQAVVDSGAEVTVISRKLFDSLPEDKRPTLTPAEGGLVAAEEDRIMPADGVAMLPFELGGWKFEWPTYVAPVTDGMLLGCDLLDARDITINTRRGLLIDGKWLPCDVRRRQESVAQVILERRVTLPANSECMLKGKISQFTQQLQVKEAILEPIGEDEREFIVARALVDCTKDFIPVRVINLSTTDIHLRSKYILGELQPASTIINLEPERDTVNIEQGMVEVGNYPDCSLATVRRVKETEGIRTGNPEVPGHLKDLFARSLENIEDDENRDKLATLLCQYQDVFSRNRQDLGSCSVVRHKIDTNDAQPIRQHFRRTPKAFEKEEETYLQEQLDAGVIVPSSSAWASPVVLVRKKDQTVRWCCDFRKLNEVTVKDAYPLPRIDMCLDCLGSAKYFTTMDLQSGYWQLEVDPADRHKTAFTTKYGLFEYSKLPMGLCNAPSTFQRCMELILRGLQWKTVLIYLDDIIVFSPSIEEHLNQLADVFQLLSSAGLKLKPSKCNLLKQEVLFLGHIVSGSGVQPNPQLISTVKEWKVPVTVCQIQQFLGLCNYYRRFIYQFSDVASPLTRLTQKDTEFEWNAECQVAFDGLKAALCDAPILAYPRSNGLFILDRDASDVGIGGILSQIQDGEERVICFASKKLNKSQTRYCVTRRELLAVVVFIQEFRHHLLGQEFVLRTDHNSLRWIFSFKAPQGQLSRWLEVLSQYVFKIVHRDGKKHGNADALSRVWCDRTACDCYESDVPVESLPCGACLHCQKQEEQWKQFNTETDDVVPLSQVKKDSKCRRVATRGRRKKSDKQSKGQTQPSVPTSNWVEPYSSTELS